MDWSVTQAAGEPMKRSPTASSTAIHSRSPAIGYCLSQVRAIAVGRCIAPSDQPMSTNTATNGVGVLEILKSAGVDIRPQGPKY